MTDTKRIAVPVQKKSGWSISWMDVTPHDGLTRFMVTTVRAGAKGNLVDLECYWGLGFCGCMKFATAYQPIASRWSRSERQITDEFRCRHIIAARLYLGQKFVDGWLAKKKKEEGK